MLVHNHLNISAFSFFYPISYNKRIKEQKYKAHEWGIKETCPFFLLFMGTMNKMHLICGNLEAYTSIFRTS